MLAVDKNRGFDRNQLKRMIYIKKIFALLMAVSLLFTLAACKSNEKLSSYNSSSTTDTVAFTAPENYATVLLVTINPEFKLYLDEQGSVLAVEPVNSDAKSMANDVENIKGDLETVIHDIVLAADKGGFVKENATVNFQVTMVKDGTINTDDILNIAKEATNKVFVDSEKTIDVNVSVAEDALKETVSSNEEASSTNITTSAESQTTASQTHKHSYSAATCTEPKKCSCGATEGKALGHKYSNGTCTVCGAKDPDFVSYTSVKNKTGIWKTQFLVDEELYNISLTLYSSAEYGLSTQYDIGRLFDKLSEDEKANILKNHKDSIITYEGIQYCFLKGDGDNITSLKEDGTTVTITDSRGAKLVLTRTAENTMTVQSSDNSFIYIDDGVKIPVGAVFTFKAE